MDYVTKKQRPASGLYPNYINPDTGNWGSSTSTLSNLSMLSIIIATAFASIAMSGCLSRMITHPVVSTR